MTLKRGIMAGDKKLTNWFNEVKSNTIKRNSVTIILLDELGEPIMNWTLDNAFPIKIQGSEIDSKSIEMAIEKLVLEHEGITLSGPKNL